jgi:hypothetical protein
MEQKKQNGLTKLKKINMVNAEKNAARTMATCWCHCTCGEYPNTDNNAFGATHSNIMYALGG